MDRREFVKAAVAMAGTLGLAQAVKAGTKAETTLIRHLAAKGDTSDLAKLEGALKAEHEAVFAYGAALQTGLLKGDAKELAKLFRESHQGHAETLSDAIKSLGGKPAPPAKSYNLGVKLATPAQIARFAYGLERGAAQAYLNAVDELENPKLKYAAAQIMADEIVHATTWYKVLGYHPLAGGFNQLPQRM
jgi:rubrerythrin